VTYFWKEEVYTVPNMNKEFFKASITEGFMLKYKYPHRIRMVDWL